MTYDVFISYSRKDSEIIDQIERELKKYDINCFVDRHEIGLGDDFAEDISKALVESEILLFVWSENSNNSPNTADEVALAIQLEKTIISFKIGTFTPHPRLSLRLVRFNRIDAITYNAQEIVKLGEKIARHLGKEKVVAPKTAPAADALAAEPEQEEFFDPEIEEAYQDGISAIRNYELSKAFDILYPLAWAKYRDAEYYLGLLARPGVRLFKLTDEQIEQLRNDAEIGVPMALHLMSVLCYERLNDRESAARYGQMAADANLPVGIYDMAFYYDVGIGVEKDAEKSRELKDRAIKMGDESAIISRARDLMYGFTMKIDFNKAERLLLKLAAKDDMVAYRNLGHLYSNLQFKRYDRKRAEEYYRKAIELGSIEAYTDLALLVGFDEYGNTVDAKAYLSLLKQGAAYNEASCASSLGMGYELGTGIEMNENQAVRWYKRAAAYGDKFAYYALARIYYYGKGSIKADEPLAWQYAMSGFKVAHSMCTTMLGIMCTDGYGQDGYTNADGVEFLKEGFFLGDYSAGYSLYKIYKEGEIVDKDEKLAMEYLQRAADEPNANACMELGKILCDPDNPDGDEFRGAKYLEMAVNMGDAEAMYRMAELYRTGYGVFADRDKAIELARRSAELGNDFGLMAMADILSHCPSEWYDEELDKDLSPEQIKADRLMAVDYAMTCVENGGYKYPLALAANLLYHIAKDDDFADADINSRLLKILQFTVEEDIAEGIYFLADIYREGRIVIHDPKKCMDLVRKAADDCNYGRAQIAMADMLSHLSAANEWYEEELEKDLDPEKVTTDRMEAVDYAIKAAENGYDYGAHLAARILWEIAAEKNGEDESINKLLAEYTKKSSDKGNAEATYRMGQLYRMGIGVDPDRDQAITFVRTAADQMGYPRALLAMADIYSHSNFNNEWYDAEYEKHITRERAHADRERALKYAEKALDAGMTYASKLAAIIAEDMATARDFDDVELNKGWHQAAKRAVADYHEFAGIVGYHLFTGFGCEKDFDEAMKYFDMDIEENQRAISAVQAARLNLMRDQKETVLAYLQKAVSLDENMRKFLDHFLATGNLDLKQG